MAYNCIIILRQSDQNSYTNQSERTISKIGIHRVRAIELLKTLFVALTKSFDVKDTKILSSILKKKVIDTMLYMIKKYPFCCISHQQSILILNSLKETFDAEDIATMNQFVTVELDA